MSELGDALFTKTQQKLLGLLYTHPDKSFYTKELLRMTGLGVAHVRRVLNTMVSVGILSMEKRGNQHHYQANKHCPIYSELLGIVRKTFGVADVIGEALAPLDHAIQLAFVYGSVAKSSDVKSSDIDLMLVGEGLVYGEVMECLTKTESQLGRDINPTIYTPEQFKQRLHDEHSFTVRVMEQAKLMIKGVIDDFREPV